jgi:hypothetical protein
MKQKSKNSSYCFIIIFFFFITTFCSNEEKSEVWVTIFVHGTIGLRSYLSINNLIKLFKDDIISSVYERGVGYIRDNSFFYKNQPIATPGLVHLNLKEQDKESGAHLFAFIFDQMVSKNKDDEHYYYTYGWSGLVSNSVRLHAAESLFKMIRKLVKQYQNSNKIVRIRLVGYSHGGNILLNLAQVWKKEYEHNKNLLIEEVIFIGMPVQKETDFLIQSPLFKKIYHFYSRNDHIQKLDCFSMKRFFSHRRFRNNLRFTLPPHLTQVEIKIKVPSVPKFSMCRCTKQPYRNCSPGHMELWFFGWPTAKISYRENFPLYPLPVAVLIPHLITLLKNNALDETNLIMELYSQDGYAFLRRRYNFERKKISFISPKRLDEIKQLALAHKPDFYSMHEYSQYIRTAIKMAQPRKKHYRSNRKKCLCAA